MARGRERGHRDRRVLGSLDLLPEECQDDVIWALEQLNDRRRTQTDILFELNDRLEVKGAGPISRSAFSRRNVRLKRHRDRLAERDAVYAGLAKTRAPEKIAEQDIVLTELMKTLIDELMDKATTSKEALELANAFRHVCVAQEKSLQRQKLAETEADRKIAKTVEAVIESVKDEAGLSKARIAQLRREFLGVRPKQESGDATAA